MYRGMEILFSTQIFTINLKIKSGAINFVSQSNFKQRFVQEFLLQK